jgi:hypothetical protein
MVHRNSVKWQIHDDRGLSFSIEEELCTNTLGHVQQVANRGGMTFAKAF